VKRNTTRTRGASSHWQCARCLVKYTSPIPGTVGVAHVCPRSALKQDLSEMKRLATLGAQGLSEALEALEGPKPDSPVSGPTEEENGALSEGGAS
jgi:hypothetical protein